jgi:uncharacterized protein (UPF0335 family)
MDRKTIRADRKSIRLDGKSVGMDGKMIRTRIDKSLAISTSTHL